MISQENPKKMLITGAASGLGKALALAAAKTHHLLLVDINVQPLNEVVDAIHAAGGQAVGMQADLSQAEGVDHLMASVRQHTSHLDVLINNAGVASSGTLMESSEAEWQRLIDINLMAVVRLSQRCYPLLKNSEQGQVVNIASFAAIANMPGMVVYNVVKTAVLSFSESLQAEWLNDDIKVLCACPSFFETNLTDSMTESPDEVVDTIKKWMKKSDQTADSVAQQILAAMGSDRLLLLTDATSRQQHRIKRWFPQFFFKQKNKLAKALGKK